MEPATPTRVAVCDRHPIVRYGLRRLLEEAPELACAGEAADRKTALRLVAAEAPGALVVGMNLPPPESLALVERLRRERPALGVLVLSAHEEEDYVFGMLAHGAGFLAKEEPVGVVLEAIRAVAEGRGGVLSRRLVEALARRPAAPKELARLTVREREVLQLLAEGHTNARIGEGLSLSEKTVRNHVTALYETLGVGRRAEAVAWAWRHGLVRPEQRG